MFYFCTYFDQHYLSRGLALYRSLREHCPEFRLWILCMDDNAFRILNELNLPGIHPISLPEFERNDEPLKTAKTNRSRIEYYFTCTPSLPLYVFDHHPEVTLITYIDADLFFFANPAPLFEEMGKGSVSIISHRYPLKNRKEKEIYGIYNVGWLSFRRDTDGLTCLKWWRERCIEWCYDRLDNGRFADQKYLDDWPTRFKNVVVLEHKGANLAPWNVNNYQLDCQNGNTITVDNQPLIFFHFHGLKQLTSWRYNSGWKPYDVKPSSVLRRRIYAPYIKTLLGIDREMLPASIKQANSAGREKINPRKRKATLGQLVRDCKYLYYIVKTTLQEKYIFIIKGHVI